MSAGAGGWRARAACRGMPTALFYQPVPTAALRVCTGCPVRAQCLQVAFDHADPYGVWGGLTPADRDAAAAAAGYVNPHAGGGA